jgi:thymidylate synthase (FAD)
MAGEQFTSKIDVSLVKWCGRDGDIIQAARVSTQGMDAMHGSAGMGLIDYLMRNRHGSPFEHGLMTFMVTAPIFVWREHHRHRIGFSYNEESGRYKELEPNFYVPEVAREQIGKPGHYTIMDTEDENLSKAMRCTLRVASVKAYAAYTDMLKAGIAREVARMVLPVNIMSTCFVTCNPRSLMSFLSLRVDSPDASFTSKPQREIQMLAEQYEHHFSRLYPLTWQAFIKNGRVAP